MTARRARVAVVSLGVAVASARAGAEAPEREPTLARSSRVVLGVGSARAAEQAIARALGPLGGRVVRSTPDGVVAEVPTGRYRQLVAELARLGDLREEQVSTSDTSAALADAVAAVDAARGAQARRERLSGVARGVDERLALARLLESSAQRVALAEARVREIRARGEVVVLDIQLRAESAESIAPPRLPVPWLDDLGHARLANPPRHAPARAIELRGLADLALTLRASYVPDPARLGGVRGAGALALDLRALGEASPVGLVGGLDLAVGASRGFLYGAQILGGAGVPLGRRFALGLSSGPGIDGITSVVPFGVRFPVELWLTWDLASFLSVSARGQNAWVLAAEERQGGSERALFGDELWIGLAVVAASREDHGGYTQQRSGWVFGAGYRELLGTGVLELRVGWGAVHAEYGGG